MHVTNDEASPGRATTCSFGTRSARARALLRAINADTITLQLKVEALSESLGCRRCRAGHQPVPQAPASTGDTRGATDSAAEPQPVDLELTAPDKRRPAASRPVECQRHAFAQPPNFARIAKARH